jgi:transforming growth factor-beta-induced protein
MADKKTVLSSLQNALVRTNLTDVLNNFANVTCLAPTNLAFSSAGSPEVNLNVSVLANALKFHTIAGAQYTTLVKDGLILTAVNGDKIQVGLRGGKLYFNDAMVLQSNVITNNGVIHVLDKVCAFSQLLSMSSLLPRKR